MQAGGLVTYGYTLPASFHAQLGDVNYPPAGGELRSWDARTGAKVSDATIGGAWTAAFSPDGERFVVVPAQSQIISDEPLMLAEPRLHTAAPLTPTERGGHVGTQLLYLVDFDRGLAGHHHSPGS